MAASRLATSPAGRSAGQITATINTITDRVHSGVYSAMLGKPGKPCGPGCHDEPTGDSTIAQSIAVPAAAMTSTLSFWWRGFTSDTIAYDWQEAALRDTSGNVLAVLLKVDSNVQKWAQVTWSMLPYAGQTVNLYFDDHENGDGKPTYWYVDDVSVTYSTQAPPTPTPTLPTRPINGGFEQGFAGWTTNGLGGVHRHEHTAGLHGHGLGHAGVSSGTSAGGDFSVWQGLAVPANAITDTLGFRYWPGTEDTIQDDWQEAEVRDMNGNVLAQIFRTCQYGAKAPNGKLTYQPGGYSLLPWAGRDVEVYFDVHDDGSTSNGPTWMYVDAVNVTLVTAPAGPNWRAGARAE